MAVAKPKVEPDYVSIAWESAMAGAKICFDMFLNPDCEWDEVVEEVKVRFDPLRFDTPPSTAKLLEFVAEEDEVF